MDLTRPRHVRHGVIADSGVHIDLLPDAPAEDAISTSLTVSRSALPWQGNEQAGTP